MPHNLPICSKVVIQRKVKKIAKTVSGGSLKSLLYWLWGRAKSMNCSFSELTGTTASDSEILSAADCLTPSCAASLDYQYALAENSYTEATYTYPTYTDPTYPTYNYSAYNYSAYAYPTYNYSAYGSYNYSAYTYPSYNYSSGNASGPAYYYYYYRV